jgi:DNA-binding MarR family transcriptional regulator
MVSVAPDVTRLLDRLTQLGLVVRERGTVDRRVVTMRLTPAGRRLVDALDQPMADLQRQRLAGLTEDQIRQLSGLLERARPDPPATS